MRQRSSGSYRHFPPIQPFPISLFFFSTRTPVFSGTLLHLIIVIVVLLLLARAYTKRIVIMALWNGIGRNGFVRLHCMDKPVLLFSLTCYPLQRSTECHSHQHCVILIIIFGIVLNSIIKAKFNFSHSITHTKNDQNGHTNDGRTQLFIGSLNRGVKCICPLSQEFRHSFFYVPKIYAQFRHWVQTCSCGDTFTCEQAEHMSRVLMFYGISNSQNFVILEFVPFQLWTTNQRPWDNLSLSLTCWKHLYIYSLNEYGGPLKWALLIQFKLYHLIHTF